MKANPVVTKWNTAFLKQTVRMWKYAEFIQYAYVAEAEFLLFNYQSQD